MTSCLTFRIVVGLGVWTSMAIVFGFLLGIMFRHVDKTPKP